MVEKDDRFKFVDDLTLLEIINLLSMQISTYDLKNHVPSDIPCHNRYIDKRKLKSQSTLNQINKWTKSKQMIMNQKKTKNMIFNFTRNHQFTTRLKLNNENVEIVSEFKLLGTIITDDLQWNENTQFLTKKAWKRMQLLHNAAKFTRKKSDLRSIYQTFIRPVLEQSAPVWHSSITEENSADLERVQKAAVRVIMGFQHVDYETSLNELHLPTLKTRRDQLCLTFAKRAIHNNKVRSMFPLRKEIRDQRRRHTERFLVQKTNTERLKRSSIPFMQNLLNINYKQNKIISLFG